MLEFLRVKIASLKAETRIIKSREALQTFEARKLRFSQQLMKAGLNDVQRGRIINRAMNRGILHVQRPPSKAPKLKLSKRKFDYVGNSHIVSSLVAGNQAYLYPPPDQSWIDRHDDTRAGLHEHRVNNVRSEARAAHLAYGFLRGVPYRAMEEKSYTPPPWMTDDVISGHTPDPIERMAIKYGGLPAQDIKQRLAQWKDEAGAWIHPDLQEAA